MSEKKELQGDQLSGIERRRFIRVLERCSISFISLKGMSGEGELVDLALRGMSLVTDVRLDVGEKIRAVFILSNGISLDLNGIIRHRQGQKGKWIYGIEFSIRDYRDLKEHLKLKNYIVHSRAKQDRFLKKEVLKRKLI